MQLGLSDFWQHMGIPAIVVAGVLIIMGLASLTVFIERVLTRFPKLSPRTPLDQLEWLPNLSFRGLGSFPVSIR